MKNKSLLHNNIISKEISPDVEKVVRVILSNLLEHLALKSTKKDQ